MELYDPATGTWSATGSMATARRAHTATLLSNGKVLVEGGLGSSAAVASAELYDPATGTWSATGSLTAARFSHTATMLPNGKVLVAGGTSVGAGALASAELYDPASGTWSATSSLATARLRHTATLLPNGKIIVAGGDTPGVFTSTSTASVEMYDPATGTWSATGSLATDRELHTATLLPNGKVLVAGGLQTSSSGQLVVASAEVYDPATGTWSATGGLATARTVHTATLLPNGNVLVVGGANSFSNGGSFLASAELYDPASGNWSATGSMATMREFHSATLLSNGKVLVAGGTSGISSSFSQASAELYDPVTGTWSATGNMTTVRVSHTATLLPNGNVLVSGGSNNSSVQVASAELYDPVTGTWSATGSMATARDTHRATLLPNGKVLVTAGSSNGGTLASAELYDPASGTWSPAGSLASARFRHTATLLPNGKVLVAGGTSNGAVALASAELYDPATGTWSAIASLATARQRPTATLLPNGKVLVAAGQGNNAAFLASAELYDVGLGFSAAWRPIISAAPSQLPLGRGLSLSGSRFQGISQASGGNTGQDSSTNYPVVQLRHLENEQVLYLPVDPATGWSDTSFTSAPVNGFPPGPSLVTVFTNGIPSAAAYLAVSPAAMLTNISTRLRVDTGDSVGISGFIIRGNSSKPVVLRGLGPSLANSGLPAASVLADPFLELHGPNGAFITLNDNWKNSPQRSQIEGTVFQPTDDREAVIVATLAPGAYTVVMGGVARTTGIGLIEVYDTAQQPDCDLANISSRGFVGTGDNVIIGGFTLSGNNPARIAVRGLGPSLANSGLSNVLADPSLELRDSNGAILVTNDDWQSDPVSAGQLTANGLAPSNPKEAAIFMSATPAGQFTVIVAGKNSGVGIGLVEVYNLK